MRELLERIDHMPLLDAATPIVCVIALTYIISVIPGLIIEAMNDTTDYE